MHIILAIIAIKRYLKEYNYKFKREDLKVPEFFINLFKAIRATFKSITIKYNRTTFEDLISRVKLGLKRT